MRDPDETKTLAQDGGGRHLGAHVDPRLGHLSRTSIFLFGVLFVSVNKNFSLLLFNRQNHLGPNF